MTQGSVVKPTGTLSTRPRLAAGRAAETFGYLGIAFLLATYYEVLSDIGEGGSNSGWLGDGALVAGLAFVVIGLWLHGGQGLGRLSGALLLVGGIQIAAGTASVLVGQADFAGDGSGVVIAGVWTLVAVVGRAHRPALSTQLGLLLAVTVLGVEIIRLLDGIVLPSGDGALLLGSGDQGSGVNTIVVLGNAAWMCLVGGLLGMVGEAEGRSVPVRPDAARRATLTRAWAAVTAIMGAYLAVSGAPLIGSLSGSGLHVWERDGILLIVIAGLLLAGLRTGAGSYFVVAALGLAAIALDLDATYLTNQLGIELTLLANAVGFFAIAVVAGAVAHRRDAPTGATGGTPLPPV